MMMINESQYAGGKCEEKFSSSSSAKKEHQDDDHVTMMIPEMASTRESDRSMAQQPFSSLFLITLPVNLNNSTSDQNQQRVAINFFSSFSLLRCCLLIHGNRLTETGLQYDQSGCCSVTVSQQNNSKEEKRDGRNMDVIYCRTGGRHQEEKAPESKGTAHTSTFSLSLTLFLSLMKSIAAIDSRAEERSFSSLTADPAVKWIRSLTRRWDCSSRETGPRIQC
jgi:hypothetical protein